MVKIIRAWNCGGGVFIDKRPLGKQQSEFTYFENKSILREQL